MGLTITPYCVETTNITSQATLRGCATDTQTAGHMCACVCPCAIIHLSHVPESGVPLPTRTQSLSCSYCVPCDWLHDALWTSG
jgi:hypothetical protein